MLEPVVLKFFLHAVEAQNSSHPQPHNFYHSLVMIGQAKKRGSKLNFCEIKGQHYSVNNLLVLIQLSGTLYFPLVIHVPQFENHWFR